MRKTIRKILDGLALAALLAVAVFQFSGASLHPEASREVYDTKMREYVLEHNLHHLREESIEVRRLLRNVERERSRDSGMTASLLALIFLYGSGRFFLSKNLIRLSLLSKQRQ